MCCIFKYDANSNLPAFYVRTWEDIYLSLAQITGISRKTGARKSRLVIGTGTIKTRIRHSTLVDIMLTLGTRKINRTRTFILSSSIEISIVRNALSQILTWAFFYNNRNIQKRVRAAFISHFECKYCWLV
jgi:hypothetical protein